jgi:hypothetical protein
MKKLIFILCLIPFFLSAQNKRIYELTTEGTITSTHYLAVDKSTFTAAKKVTVNELTRLERVARQTQDNTIEAGAGLETNGTYATDESTNYINAAGFVARGLTQNIKNSAHILDSVIFLLETIQYTYCESNLKAQINLTGTEDT